MLHRATMTEEVGLSGNIDLTTSGEEIPLLGAPGTISQ